MSAVFSKRRQIFRGRRSVVPRNAAAPGIFVYRRWMPPEKRARARLQGRAIVGGEAHWGIWESPAAYKMRGPRNCHPGYAPGSIAQTHAQSGKKASSRVQARPAGQQPSLPGRRKRPSNACRDAFRGNDFHHFQCPTSAFPLRTASYPPLN